MNFAVYTKDGCPYCDKVKQVLELTGSRFVVYNLGEHFEKKEYYVLKFAQTLRGLSIGAPVEFK